MSKPRIVCALQVYGDPLEHPQKETYWGNVNCIGERSCYDEGKRAAECLTFDYHREHNLDVSITSCRVWLQRLSSWENQDLPTFQCWTMILKVLEELESCFKPERYWRLWFSMSQLGTKCVCFLPKSRVISVQLSTVSVIFVRCISLLKCPTLFFSFVVSCIPIAGKSSKDLQHIWASNGFGWWPCGQQFLDASSY